MAQLTVKDMLAKGYVAQLAQVIGVGGMAEMLLALADFPASRAPAAADGAPAFWLRVSQLAADGVMTGSHRLERLLGAAHHLYPGNGAFAPFEQYAPGATDPVDAPESEASVVEAGCVIRILDGDPQIVMQTARRVAGAHRLSPITATPGDVLFQAADLDFPAALQLGHAIRAALRERGQTVRYYVADHENRDYLVNQIYAEGPDQARFELNNIPASTRVEDIARGILSEYDSRLWAKDERGQPRPPVVDHVKPDGSYARLDPATTLAESGVLEGDPINVAPLTPAPGLLPKRTPVAPDPAFSAQSVVMNYPAPVSLTYQRFRGVSGSVSRLQALFHALDALLRYTVTLGVADLIHCLTAAGKSALPGSGALCFLSQRKDMTLGNWLVALHATAVELARQPKPFVPELAARCGPNEDLVKHLLGPLVWIRNKVVHGAGSITLSDDRAWEVLERARPLLEAALMRIDFIASYSLVFVTAAAEDAGDKGPFGYLFHSCMGPWVTNSTDAPVEEVPFRLRLEAPFVVAPDGSRLLYLWPLLTSRVSPDSKRNSLYVFERIADRGKRLPSSIETAGIEFPEPWPQSVHDAPRASHDWLFDRRDRPPAPPPPPALDVPPPGRMERRLWDSRLGWLSGKQLGSNTLLRSIARGGVATVYEALDTDKRTVAVKVIEDRYSTEDLKRFKSEFDKLKAANHDGIVPCYERGIAIIERRQVPWYSMEYALGGDLAQRIQQRRDNYPGRIHWDVSTLREQLVGEFKAVAGAAAYMHGRGWVHRDIKPSNVLIMDGGRLCLSDFGLLKNLDPSTDSQRAVPPTSIGALVGTPAYMAPEQQGGKEVERPADVYSLGILLAELTTGQQPRRTMGPQQGPTLNLDEHSPRLPGPLVNLIHLCTDANPKQRPRDAGELLNAFRTVPV
jgi:hypothetical protein